jgi:hypothetical protein
VLRVWAPRRSLNVARGTGRGEQQFAVVFFFWKPGELRHQVGTIWTASEHLAQSLSASACAQ